MAELDCSRSFVEVDLENAAAPPPSPATLTPVQKSLQAALSDVAECRAKLEALGEPPDHEAVDQARSALSSIDDALASELERLHLSPPPPDADPREWAAQLVQKEKELQETAQNAQLPYRTLIQTDELYRCYELLLKDAEADMVRLSSTSDSVIPLPKDALEESEEEPGPNEDVLKILSIAKEGPLTEVNLRGRGLISIPDAFGRISTLVLLDLSQNRLEVLSDSIGGLINLETLNLEHNNIESLPDSIGLLKNLKVLNVSSNKIMAFPESILHCSSLVSLVADLNQLSYLPSQIGFCLTNLEQLSVKWNKLRTLPSSLCSLKSLKRLELKFNHLKALPTAIGNLTNLEVLDASCNFMDLQIVPDTVGDLTSLVEIDLSCNQIKTLPPSFGRLQNLKKVNILENPLLIPPLNIAESGCEEIMAYMRERWQNYVDEKNRPVEEGAQVDTTWGSWFGKVISAVTQWPSSSSPTRPSEASSVDQLLDQQL